MPTARPMTNPTLNFFLSWVTCALLCGMGERMEGVRVSIGDAPTVGGHVPATGVDRRLSGRVHLSNTRRYRPPSSAQRNIGAAHGLHADAQQQESEYRDRGAEHGPRAESTHPRLGLRAREVA